WSPDGTRNSCGACRIPHRSPAPRSTKPISASAPKTSRPATAPSWRSRRRCFATGERPSVIPFHLYADVVLAVRPDAALYRDAREDFRLHGHGAAARSSALFHADIDVLGDVLARLNGRIARV